MKNFIVKKKNIFMPSKLEEICNYLKKELSYLLKVSYDGRIESAVWEEAILEKLSKKFPDIIIPNIREWFDFAFYDNEGNFIPVNIKISKMTAADNVDGKIGLFYAITGTLPPKNCEWSTYWNELKERWDYRSDKADYFFIIVNKNNTSDVFYTSLKQLQKVVPNGNNFPFQCRWGENRNFAYRSNEGAKNFLYSAIDETAKKDTRTYYYYEVFNDFAKYNGDSLQDSASSNNISEEDAEYQQYLRLKEKYEK